MTIGAATSLSAKEEDRPSLLSGHLCNLTPSLTAYRCNLGSLAYLVIPPAATRAGSVIRLGERHLFHLGLNVGPSHGIIELSSRSRATAYPYPDCMDRTLPS